MKHRARLGVVLASAVVLIAATAGCSGAPAPEQQSAPSFGDSESTAESLAPVVQPDLTALAGPVQQQIKKGFAALAQANADPTVKPSERAQRFGELGNVLLAATFFDEAALSYLRAEVLDPEEPRWTYLLAHARLRKGDRDAAARAFERLLSLQPGYLPAMVWLGDTYLDLGRTDAAQAMFARALAQQPDSAAALFGAGRTALARQEYEQAAQRMERALLADPLASVIHYPLAMAYRGMGQRERADALLQRRGTAAPDLPDPLLQQADVVLESAVFYEGLGMQALRRQNWGDAIQLFRSGLAVAPADASLRYWMATAMIASGDVAGAEVEFRTVVRTQPDFAKAHFSLGAVLDQRGQKREALAEYESAVQYAPNMPEARLRLGDTLQSMGQPRQAFTQYEATVKLDPGIAEAWIGGAQALLAERQRDQAREWIASGRRLHPNRREWAEVEAQTNR